MKKLISLLCSALLLLAAVGVSFAAQQSRLASLHGGNFLQALEQAFAPANDNKGVTFADLKVLKGENGNTVTTIADNRFVVQVFFHKNSGSVDSVVFAIPQWTKETAPRALIGMFVCTGAISRLANPKIQDDDIGKVSKALGFPNEWVDGKEREISINNTKISMQFTPGVGVMFMAQ